MTSTPAGTAVGPLLPAGCPLIVGIVNITADSFSDGGRYLDPAAAIAHARRLRADGADIIELGPAASHPDSVPVTAAEEQRRLAPVLGQLAADGIPVAVDSFRPETQRFAISAGATCVNDIHGFSVPGMYPVLAASACRLIVMHCVQPSGPATRVATDPATAWASIGQFFSRRLAALQAAGISRDRLIIDPGLGYFLGSTPKPSLAALAGIRQLKDNFRHGRVAVAGQHRSLRPRSAHVGEASADVPAPEARSGTSLVQQHPGRTALVEPVDDPLAAHKAVRDYGFRLPTWVAVMLAVWAPVSPVLPTASQERVALAELVTVAATVMLSVWLLSGALDGPSSPASTSSVADPKVSSQTPRDELLLGLVFCSHALALIR
jgi:dihydropteroate synthase type 2